MFDMFEKMFDNHVFFFSGF